MDDEGATAWLILWLGFLAVVVALGGFCAGRGYESRFWTKYYKDEMIKVCLDCSGITTKGAN